jgi:hypothetical protein
LEYSQAFAFEVSPTLGIEASVIQRELSCGCLVYTSRDHCAHFCPTNAKS